MSWAAWLTSGLNAGRAEPALAVRPLVDEFVESYVCWREACDDVRSAYAGWGKREAPARDLGFGGYRAALDREEQAARVHSDWAERLRSVER
jgi:hypothetical protein